MVEKEENKLPAVTQEVILGIDATPDKEYPLRILRAYRENCNCKWVTDKPDLLFDKMNKDCDKRVKILDEAIGVLERHYAGVWVWDEEQ